MGYVVCEYKGGKYKPVSGEFSFPQPAKDYIAIASKNGGGKGWRVMFKNGCKLMSIQEAEANRADLF